MWIFEEPYMRGTFTKVWYKQYWSFVIIPSFSSVFSILISSALHFLVGSFFSVLCYFVTYQCSHFLLIFVRMMMDFSFCNSIDAFSYAGGFGFGALDDIRTPAISARSLSFCSCDKLHVGQPRRGQLRTSSRVQ